MGQADHIWKEPLHRTRGHLQPKKTSKEQLPAIVCFHFHPSPVEGKLAFRSLSDAFFSTGELIPWLSRRHWNVIFLCFHCLNNRPLNVKRQQPPRVPQLVEPLAYYIANIRDIWKASSVCNEEQSLLAEMQEGDVCCRWCAQLCWRFFQLLLWFSSEPGLGIFPENRPAVCSWDDGEGVASRGCCGGSERSWLLCRLV